MSIALKVTIDTSELKGTLQAREAAMKDGLGMHGAIATASEKAVKDHLTANYLPRDGPRGDFWADVIKSTQSIATDNAATVTLYELGIWLRYHGSSSLPGGGVTPGKSISSYTGELTRALAIPSAAVPVAGGRQIRPGRAGVLAFIRSDKPGDTVGFLVEGVTKTAQKGKNKGKPYTVPKEGGALLYTLRTITRHAGDKNILPPPSKLTDAAATAVVDFIASFKDDAGTTPQPPE